MPKSSLAVSDSPSPQETETESIAYVNAEERIRRTAILAIIYLLPAMWILQPVIVDPDIWWHLQTGKWVLGHGTLPTSDPFSAYGEGKPLVAYSWLFEIGMYGLVHLCGTYGVILYTLTATWLIVLVLHRIIGSRCHDFLLSSVLLTGSIVALSKLFTPRPWLLTILFFAITLEVVLSIREGKSSRWFWLLPVAYMVWANIHIQFIYGLSLLGLACVAPLIDRLAQSWTGTQPTMTWRSPLWNKLIGLVVLCTLATFVTPSHIHVYELVVEYAGQTGFWEFVQEMKAPPFRSLADWSMLALFSLALFKLGRQTTLSSFEVLFLLTASVLAFRGQRDVWFLLLACLAVLAPLKIRRMKPQFSIVPRGCVAPVTFCVVGGVIFLLSHREFSEAKIEENTAKVYPVAAAGFVEQYGYQGPLYNHFDWGGYLIWRLPHLKVSMDGRGNVHGDERIKQSLRIWNGHAGWSQDPELGKAEIVIAQKDMALAAILRLDSRFSMVYQDETAAVFARVPKQLRN